MERRGHNPMDDKKERLRRRRLEEAASAQTVANREQERALLFGFIQKTLPPEAAPPSAPRRDYILPFFRRNG